MPRYARAKDNGWIKFFANGSRHQGLDRDIDSGLCSWSRSQLHSMIGAKLNHDGVSIEINGPGDYWQSDSLEAIMRLGQTTRPMFCSRRIQRKILDTDKFLVVRKPTRHHLLLEISPSNPTKNLDNVEDVLVFKKEEIGQWLIAEVEADQLTTTWRVSQERI